MEKEEFMKKRAENIEEFRDGVLDLMEVLGVSLMEGIFACEMIKAELMDQGRGINENS